MKKTCDNCAYDYNCKYRAYANDSCGKWMPNDAPIKANRSMRLLTESGDDCSSVNHPNHYKSRNGLEVIDIVEAFTDELQGIEATDTGNILKYICRWKKKNGIQDLMKAKWYIEHLISHLENEEKESNEL